MNNDIVTDVLGDLLAQIERDLSNLRALALQANEVEVKRLHSKIEGLKLARDRVADEIKRAGELT